MTWKDTRRACTAPLQAAVRRTDTGGHALDLPFPPSANHYYRRGRGRTHISERGREYRRTVAELVAAAVPAGLTHTTPVAVEVELRPPDRRRRDLDNAWKVLLDALTAGGMWTDDHLVHDQRARWGPVEAPGRALVRVEELEAHHRRQQCG